MNKSSNKARKEYYRNWRKNNKEKVKIYNKNYWEKKDKENTK